MLHRNGSQKQIFLSAALNLQGLILFSTLFTSVSFFLTSFLAFSPFLSSVSPSSARSTSSQFSLSWECFQSWRLSSGISLFPLLYFYPSLPFYTPVYPYISFFLPSSSNSPSLLECVSSLRDRGSDYSGSL